VGKVKIFCVQYGNKIMHTLGPKSDKLSHAEDLR